MDTYYVEGKNAKGEHAILRLLVDNGVYKRVDEVTRDKMMSQIERNKTL